MKESVSIATRRHMQPPVRRINTNEFLRVAVPRIAKAWRSVIPTRPVAFYGEEPAVLRRVLRLAVEWGITSSAPRIKLLRGEHHRERVVSPGRKKRAI